MEFLIELKDFLFYFITEDGLIYSNKFGDFRPKKLTKHDSGFYFVTFQKNRRQSTKKLHRLLAETFIPNPDNKRYVQHIDNNKDNNNLNNLIWK